MTKRKIASLPTQPLTWQRTARPKDHRRTLLVGLYELGCLIVALDLASLAFWCLAPWPVYRIVAFVIIFIVWSNVASELAREKTQGKTLFDTVSTQAVQVAKHLHRQPITVKPAHSEDTTAYLNAIKKESYANTQTRRLHDTVPHDHQYRRVLHHPEATPVR